MGDKVLNLNRIFNEVSIHLKTLKIELIAPTTVKTTEHYMENGKKSKDSQMVGDYGVEEWKDGGKFTILTDKSIIDIKPDQESLIYWFFLCMKLYFYFKL